jgi:hypothetical protein
VEAQTQGTGTPDEHCSICDVPVLLDELPGFDIPAPLLRYLKTTFVPQLPESPAPCIVTAGSRAPPQMS